LPVEGGDETLEALLADDSVHVLVVHRIGATAPISTVPDRAARPLPGE
jgi:hypothetical protein